MTTYFGYEANLGSEYDPINYNNLLWDIAAFTCPGSGSQNIQELSAYGYRGAAAINIRLGVYLASDRSLKAEGTGEVAASTTPGWQGHMTQASVKAAGGSSPGVLTGGVDYILAVTNDGAGGATWNQSGYYPGSIGERTSYDFTDFTGGMPDPLTADAARDDYSSRFKNIRCGVDAASGWATTVSTGRLVGTDLPMVGDSPSTRLVVS